MPGKIIETVEQIQNVAMLTKKEPVEAADLYHLAWSSQLRAQGFQGFEILFNACFHNVVLNELEILIFISLPLLRNAFSNYFRTSCTFSLFKGH